MKKMLSFIISIFILLILINACNQHPISPSIEKSYLVEYANCGIFDKNGFSVDSPFYYFPKSIFVDTVKCFIGKFGNPVKSLFTTKEYYSRIHEVPIESLRDTFAIEIDTTYFSCESYLLSKMLEPSLSDHYLGKDIYRMTAFRSFDNPISIRIEKDNGKIHLFSKELKIDIHYKKELSKVRFVPPVNEDEAEHIEESWTYPDSIDVYDYSAFSLVHNNDKELELSLWNDLESIADSSNFWKSKPELYINHVQIDGSMWFLEGHTAKGYQIKRIPSPNFDIGDYRHKYDTLNFYAQIFKKLISYSNLKDIELY